MRNSDCEKCQWSNSMSGTQDGSYGAEKAAHDSMYHPEGHSHEWTTVAPEGYEWAMRYPERGFVWCSICRWMTTQYTVDHPSNN